ncbi:MAG: hypothetical protein NTU53_07050, partial [Planctomycetota bacterium]|nr:hypothetical protein [Planctomycetota bacterium]
MEKWVVDRRRDFGAVRGEKSVGGRGDKRKVSGDVGFWGFWVDFGGKKPCKTEQNRTKARKTEQKVTRTDGGPYEPLMDRDPEQRWCGIRFS